MAIIGSIIGFVLLLFFWLLIIRMLLSWVPVVARDFRPKGVVLVLFETVYSLTDPPVKACRRVMPRASVGGVQWDLGFLLLSLIVLVLMQVNRAIFF